MVSEADPSMRTGFDGHFIEVVQNGLLSGRGAWEMMLPKLESLPSG
jgi:hypothetical protein